MQGRRHFKGLFIHYATVNIVNTLTLIPNAFPFPPHTICSIIYEQPLAAAVGKGKRLEIIIFIERPRGAPIKAS